MSLAPESAPSPEFANAYFTSSGVDLSSSSLSIDLVVVVGAPAAVVCRTQYSMQDLSVIKNAKREQHSAEETRISTYDLRMEKYFPSGIFFFRCCICRERSAHSKSRQIFLHLLFFFTVYLSVCLRHNGRALGHQQSCTCSLY